MAVGDETKKTQFQKPTPEKKIDYSPIYVNQTEHSCHILQSAVPDEASDVSSFTWYQRNLSREDAQKRLMKRRLDGMYVVRESKHGGVPYALSLYYDGKVYHIKIRQKADSFLLGESRENEPVFPSLPVLIAHFQSNPIILSHDKSTSVLLEVSLPQ